MREVFKDNKYTAYDENNNILLTIEKIGECTYKAKNQYSVIVAKIEVVDDYKTLITCIENKNICKNGVYRKSNKLKDHNLSWLNYMLQTKGFIRKQKPVC